MNFQNREQKCSLANPYFFLVLSEAKFDLTAMTSLTPHHTFFICHRVCNESLNITLDTRRKKKKNKRRAKKSERKYKKKETDVKTRETVDGIKEKPENNIRNDTIQ